MSDAHPFVSLTPELILEAVESLGYFSDGRLLALNSYENRVYQVGIEDAEPLIAKIYRPQRWSDEQILEDHQFCFELFENEVPVVCPFQLDNQTLFHYQNFRFALFPRRAGRAPELDNLDNLYRLGQWLGRIHAVGAVKRFQTRPTLDIKSFGEDSVAFISGHFIPADLQQAYDSLTADLLRKMKQIVAAHESITTIRVHGDCHPGNILWRDDRPNFVDLDDARMAPAVQDVWMLLSGDRSQQLIQLSEVLEGYQDFYDFDLRELHLVEVFRTLRILHFSAWLGRRWQDPAFPRYFPWFNSARYWGEHILQLREQYAALFEPPLSIQRN